VSGVLAVPVGEADGASLWPGCCGPVASRPEALGRLLGPAGRRAASRGAVGRPSGSAPPHSARGDPRATGGPPGTPTRNPWHESPQKMVVRLEGRPTPTDPWSAQRDRRSERFSPMWTPSPPGACSPLPAAGRVCGGPDRAERHIATAVGHQHPTTLYGTCAAPPHPEQRPTGRLRRLFTEDHHFRPGRAEASRLCGPAAGSSL